MRIPRKVVFGLGFVAAVLAVAAGVRWWVRASPREVVDGRAYR